MSYAERFRITPRRKVDLRKISPRETGGIVDRIQATALLAESIERLSNHQEVLFAQDEWAVLIVLQALDAAGKDGTVKHVLTGVNPRGVRVTGFGAPSKEELDHDYLWRVVRNLPERGVIGIHNRSHYEEVIVTRVHPEVLASQRLPQEKRGPDLWKRRFKEINRFERYLVDNGTIVLKFFLHISKHEQWERLIERMEDPDKYWKSRAGDLYERLHWPAYMAAYEDVFRHTSTAHAPWYVIPADHKWFAWLAVAEILNETLAGLKLHYPKMPDSMQDEWEKAREELRKA